jgi:hypothetical protein
MAKQQSKSFEYTAKPFCKFCEGAGESKEAYTSHWQFSKPVDGKLTCPKLLNYKCKTCNETGHIEKRCPFKKQKKEQEKEKKSQFCRFCYNAHCENYLDHNQFDKDGFVICPNLSVIECQLCGVKGHTKRYCSQDPNYIGNVTPKKTEKPQIIPGAPKKQKNMFAALEIGDEKVTIEVIVGKAVCRLMATPPPAPEVIIDVLQSQNMEKFPHLRQAKTPTAKTTMLTGWAKMAAMPAKKTVAIINPVVVVENVARLAEYDGWTDDEEEVVVVAESTSWADM